MNHFHGIGYEIWADLGLVLGRLAVLKISDRVVKYATFEGIFFKNIAASELKSCIKPSILKRED